MMRIVYQLSIGLFLLAGVATVTAQTTATPKTTGNRTVDKDTWVFRAGDSTGWASPAYNDHHWANMAPDVDLDDNPTLWKTGRGWFRQTFRFRRLRNKDVTITIRQFGQSEVYLDGRRLAVLKPAQYDSGGSQRMAGLLPIRIADTSQHVLAVRYAFRRDPLIGKIVRKIPFQLSFDLSNQATVELMDTQRSSNRLNYITVGVFGILSLLHFLFYRANPTQRINRILAITMLGFSLTFLINDTESVTGTLTLDSVQGALDHIGFSTSFALLLLSVYTYLGRRPGWMYWTTVVVLAGDIVYVISVGQVSKSLAWIPLTLVLVEYIRVSWLAKRQNPDADARLPWNSLRVALFSLTAILVLGIGWGIISSVYGIKDGLSWLFIPILLLSLVGVFSIPVGLSLSLVRDYARTYLSLRQKLDEVEQLSAQTLAYEQEKQHLLARQNETLEQQVAHRTAELKQSLTELRETQTQLIQREKLASLGELTAGIAHEIQNPLNFVNNFSEVSTELVGELADEQQKPNRDQALEAELLGDLKQSLQKITHHGGRASSIVRGMLEHSRSSTGQRELTDLNALADEYLRLAYHSLQRSAGPVRRSGTPGDPATASMISVDLRTEFAPGLSKVSVVSQDIGRVLLNLYNNAFYATGQRARQNPPGYQPTVTVQTECRADSVRIRVRDNGTGMSAATQTRIFQPFFTTKPTGEGTGLGLSLSYDIVTKGHGGTLTVETVEGEGSTFVVCLPVSV